MDTQDANLGDNSSGLLSHQNLFLRRDTWTTTGVILEENLRRLDFYARHIRSLELRNFKHKVSSHVYSTILRYRGHTELLPGLRKLTIQSIDGISMANRLIIPIISSSSLTAVSFSDISQITEVEVASLLHSLSEPKTPFLQDLTLSGHLSSLSLDLVKRFAKLTTLSVVFYSQGADTDILGTCSKMANLKTLSLKFILYRSPFIPPPPNTVYNLNSLTTLTIEAIPDHILRIVECVEVPNVDAITLTDLSDPQNLYDESSPDSLDTCVRRCAIMAPSLQVLEINAKRGTAMTWKTLLPLQNCVHLRRLEVCIKPFVDTNVAELYESGEWTSLETLKFTLVDYIHTCPCPTLFALNTVATHCLNLKTLKICIQIDHNMDLKSLQKHVQTVPRSCHNLETLEIYGTRDPLSVGYTDNATMTAGVVVSRYIDHLFPRLKVLTFRECCTDEWRKGVVDMVKAYQEMRVQHT
ncbi:hypothetical protein BDZ97DRAFT_858797 [Flammula alnicola]|nr:hypothetical protein BDZ97DRAFT_858797 [Flammula alnicola]